MTKQTVITYNLKGLEELKKAVGDTLVARVGVLAPEAQRTDKDSGLNNAEIGVIHEFGSYTKHIPIRSFLRLPFQLKGKELAKAMNTESVKTAMSAGDYYKVFQLLGVAGVAIVKGAFSTGGYGQWPKLKPATIAAKKSAAILIDTGQLRNAITFDVTKKGNI